MSKHTPSPWHVQDNDGSYCMVRGEPQPQVSNGKTIAKVWLQGSDYNDANAHLIAAAPDLLESLKRAYAQIIEFLNEGDFKRKVLFDAGYIVDAIEKAEGSGKNTDQSTKKIDLSIEIEISSRIHNKYVQHYKENAPEFCEGCRKEIASTGRICTRHRQEAILDFNFIENIIGKTSGNSDE